MTFDGRTGMSLTWNDLGLVEKVSLNDTVLVNYSYLADGTKVSALDGDGDGLLYLGSSIYKKTGDSIELESAGFAGGRFVARETSPGVSAMAAGGALATAGVEVTASTVGAGVVVGGPAVAAGAEMAAAGAATAVTGGVLVMNSSMNKNDGYERGKGDYEKPHVHFKDGNTLNQDGTWKHGGRDLTNKEKEFLKRYGWETK
ncbi:MAG: hypothetical protein IJB06_06385 [Bacteroidales bacterium]|nr:hypothetical protein [Bacteroidales bacterium]